MLDEPFNLPADSPLMVTVLPGKSDPLSLEQAEWSALAVESLARAYGEDEPEYTLADVKPKP